MNQMTNMVVIEGILAENNLEKATFVDKNGIAQDVIRGNIKVKTTITEGDEVIDIEPEIRFFTKRLKNDGNDHPGYINLNTLMTDGQSIAKVGIENASCVRITGATVTMQEYYDPSGRFVSFPAISGSFVNIIRKEDMAAKAKAELEVVIVDMNRACDNDGVELDPPVLNISGMSVGYNGYTDLIPIVVKNPAYIPAVEATYGVGDIVKINAKLNFSSKTEMREEQVEIGDPILKPYTVKVSDIIMAGMASSSYECSAEDVQKYLNSRQQRLEDSKNKKKAAPATAERSKSITQAKATLGF